MAARLVVLKNGLRAVLAPCEAESVAFGLFIESGSRHESAANAGIYHLPLLEYARRTRTISI